MRYCLFFPYGDIDKYIFKEVMDLKQVSTVFLNKPNVTGIKALLRRVHRSESVNTYIKIPLKTIWEDLDYINNIVQSSECLVFTTTALVYLDIRFLKTLKDKGHKMVLIIYDSLSGHSHHLNAVKNCIFDFPWDFILSFDVNDCQKFGFTSIDFAMYSCLQEYKSMNSSDIYYIGKDKAGRNAIIKKIYEELNRKGVSCNFNIKEVDRIHTKRRDMWDKGMHIFYNHNIPYEEVIGDVLATNVILEYLHDGQQAQSLRYYEAVCYNKKLLTNNKNVSKLPFYNPKYMKCFSSAMDIDFEWIKKREKINYGYNGEFSPVRILDIIESNIM